MRTMKSYFLAILSLFLITGFTATVTAAAAEKEARVKAAQRIDLNSASEEQLKELPGIGDMYAKKIVANRPYRSVKDLSKSGLPEHVIGKISSQVTVKKTAAAPARVAKPGVAAKRSVAAASRNGKVDLNTASKEELEALPGLGPVFAQKIIDHRPYASAKDLDKAGLPEGTAEKIASHIKASRSSAAGRASTRRPMPTAQRSAAKVEKPSATQRTQESAAPESKSAPADDATGNERVWLNTDTNIYHRKGDRWYGITKSGKFISEEEAIREGARASER